jgi:hypothetical protein
MPVSYGQFITLLRYNLRMRKLVLIALVSLGAAFAVEQNDVEFSTPAGLSLTLDLKTPDGNGPFPATIIVHGGGFSTAISERM